METEIIRQFLLLSQNSHMTYTAKLFGISQSNLSKNIAHLEEDLGFPLFDRLGRRLRLNANGEQFAECARKVLQTLDQGMAAMLAGKAEPGAPLLLAWEAFPSLLAPVLSAFAATSPETPLHLFRLTEPKTPGDGSAPEPDFRFLSRSTLEPPPDPGAGRVTELLREEPLVAVGIRRLGAQPKAPTDLRRWPFAVLSQDGDVFEHLTAHVGRMAGFMPQVIARTDDLNALLALTRLGTAAAILPDGCWGDLPPDGFCFPLPKSAPRWQLYLVRRQDAALSPAGTAFLNCLRQHFPGEESPQGEEQT